MAAHDLTDRVEVLEVKVAALEGLPESVSGVESQIVQLRNEMRGGFSAVHQEMHDLGETLRQEMREGQQEFRQEMRGLEGTLRDEMRALNEDTKSQMRVLHEDVIDRISRIGEGAPRSRRRRK
jgi:phosphoglycerate-specific signal transduction histidine kinase